MFWHIVLAITLLKLLFVPYYTSTDFEVHRNWLAITYSLPLEKWYTESTSEWTLDYPPFFAWFEWTLARMAQLFDTQMLNVQNLQYKSVETLLFQRISVIISDIVLAIGVKACADAINGRGQGNKQRPQAMWSKENSSLSHCHYQLAVLVMANSGLLMVDHIHFQYNGILFGILLLSIGRMLTGNFIQSSAYFVILLNMKHIFLYSAPAYFVYLFKSYCHPVIKWTSFTNLVKLALTVILGFLLSFGPFLVNGQLFIVISRLFPVNRGLTHAYWAPNFWAMYCFLDRCLATLAKRMNPDFIVPEGSTSGLVQQSTFAFLPNVPPSATAILTIIIWLPVLYKLWKHPKEPEEFLRAMTLCTFTAFFFGYHVHEKAILMVTVPWTILFAAQYEFEQQMFLFLTTTANFSLFPLLFREEETLVKVFLHLFYITCCTYFSQNPSAFGVNTSSKGFTGHRRTKRVQHANDMKQVSNMSITHILEYIYLTGAIIVFAFPYVMSSFMDADQVKKFAFLPLLNYSVYSACGNCYVFVRYYWTYLAT